MSYFCVTLSKSIRWSICEDDPPLYELKSYPGWVFVNPLSHEHKIIPTVIIGERALIETSVLMFIPPKDISVENIDMDVFSNYLEKFLKGVRYWSKQAELIGIEINSFYEMRSLFEDFDNMDIAPRSLNWPHLEPKIRVYIREYRFKTAATWKHVALADKMLSDSEPSIYIILLLDAISAFIEHDYVRALLYSAISVETVASTVMDETYNKTRREAGSKESLRIVTFSPSARNRATKATVIDPVYEFIADRGNFRNRIHEQSLYLLGRSLMLDDESLYKEAVKLYDTRNKIAHMGKLPSENIGNYFQPNKADALNAINCAVKVFEWFGINDVCVVPSIEEPFVWGLEPLQEDRLEENEDHRFYPWSDDV